MIQLNIYIYIYILLCVWFLEFMNHNATASLTYSQLSDEIIFPIFQRNSNKFP